MRDDEEEDKSDDWKVEYVKRDLAPALEALSMLGLRYAVLRGHEVVVCRDVREWASMFEGTERVVEQTTVNRYWISTVFLGLNHSFFRAGPPQWFETMVFEELEDGRTKSDRFCRRYTTWEEAEAGHAETVEIIRYGNF